MYTSYSSYGYWCSRSAYQYNTLCFYMPRNLQAPRITSVAISSVVESQVLTYDGRSTQRMPLMYTMDTVVTYYMPSLIQRVLTWYYRGPACYCQLARFQLFRVESRPPQTHSTDLATKSSNYQAQE